MQSEPPQLPEPTYEPPTPDEIERALAAWQEIWPSFLLLIQRGHGTLTLRFHEGDVATWEVAPVRRYKRHKS